MGMSKLLWLLFPMLFMSFAEPAPGGTGSGDGDSAGNGGQAGGQSGSAPDQGVQALIARHNSDLMAVISTLYAENYSYRDKIRDLKGELKDAKAKLPGDGQSVLAKAEAELLEKYKALGEIDKLAQLQGEFENTRQVLGTLQKDGLLREVADVTGYKLPVLKTLGGSLDFEIKEVEKDGEKKQVAFVKNGTGDPTPVSDYAAKNWVDFLPALQTATPPQGTRFPSQDSGGGGAKGNILDDFLNKTKEARASLPNPLSK